MQNQTWEMSTLDEVDSSWGPDPVLDMKNFTFRESCKKKIFSKFFILLVFLVFYLLFVSFNSSMAAFLHLLPTTAQQMWMGFNSFPFAGGS